MKVDERLTFVLLRSSLHVTFHVWKPFVRFEIKVMFGTPLTALILLTLTVPSKVILHVRFDGLANCSVAVKLKLMSSKFTFPLVGKLRITEGPKRSRKRILPVLLMA